MKNLLSRVLARATFLAVFISVGLCHSQSATITVLPGLGGSIHQAAAMNQNGQITGFSYMPGDMIIDAFLFDGQTIGDLGTLGGTMSFGRAINSSGAVVGESTTEWDLESHAFVYANETMSDLGTLGGSYSSAVAINSTGMIAGRATTALDMSQHAFLYVEGTMLDLGSLGGDYSEAIAVNESGAVAGDSVTPSWQNHAFLWKDGTLLDLGTFGGGYSSSGALNDLDQVVGESALAGGQRHAFLWQNGSLTDLGTLGGSYSSASGINNLGQVIGLSTTANDAETHAFVYSAGVMTDLGTLGGTFSTPSAINNRGQIVGDSATAEGTRHVFLWQNGVMVDLNTLLPADSGWELWGTGLINDSGRIVGYGLYQGSVEQFVLDLGTENQNQPPVAAAGNDQVVECQNGAVLDGTQSSDPDGDTLSFEWSLGSTILGTTSQLNVSLPLGTNLVSLTVTDPSGASSTASVSIVVVDLSPPVLSGPKSVTLAADSTCQAEVPDLLAQVSASDNCADPSLLIVAQNPAAGTLVEKGQALVTVTATDPSGNSGTLAVTLLVVDATAPEINSVSATPEVLTPPNRQMVPVTVSVSATDNCELPSSKIISITCNEVASEGDIQITGDLTALLAAVKNPTGDTRVYTITVQTTDTAGNASFGTTDVSVPKSSGNGNGNSTAATNAPGHQRKL